MCRSRTMKMHHQRSGLMTHYESRWSSSQKKSDLQCVKNAGINRYFRKWSSCCSTAEPNGIRKKPRCLTAWCSISTTATSTFRRCWREVKESTICVSLAYRSSSLKKKIGTRSLRALYLLEMQNSAKVTNLARLLEVERFLFCMGTGRRMTACLKKVRNWV